MVLADVLSVLVMAVEDKERLCLNYRLAGSQERVSSFGHPYIRSPDRAAVVQNMCHVHVLLLPLPLHLTLPLPLLLISPLLLSLSLSFLFWYRQLCSQLPEEWVSRNEPEEGLLGLVRDISVYCLAHNAEAEACDLLMEIEKIGMIVDLVSEDTYHRVCLYLTRCDTRTDVHTLASLDASCTRVDVAKPCWRQISLPPPPPPS